MIPTRLFEIPYYQLEKGPLAASIGGKHMKGHNYSYSTKDFIKLANQVSLGLLQMGVKPGDRISLISHNNRPEWNIIDIGMSQIGVINVPVYPTVSRCRHFLQKPLIKYRNLHQHKKWHFLTKYMGHHNNPSWY